MMVRAQSVGRHAGRGMGVVLMVSISTCTSRLRVYGEEWPRSNSASTASMRNTILPAAFVVSMDSDRLTRSAPDFASRSLIESASLVDRANSESK